MDYVTLGRTGLRASVVGLGAGGHSRLGLQTGGSEADAATVVRRALELGVNFIDTAEAYGTEAAIGQALRGLERDAIILSTKKTIRQEDGRPIGADELVRGLEASLRRLGTTYVDIYHLHGVPADQYEYAREALVPPLLRLRDEGKIRFLGITEAFGRDTAHRMLSRAVLDEPWDVVMVGFNILNQSAREHVLAHTIARNIGVLDMFAVRQALSRPEKLRETMADLVGRGLVRRDAFDADDPLGFLIREDGASSIPDAAYRFCRAEPGVHVVLSGTGNPRHLEENIVSILKPPLPGEDRERLMRLFGGIDVVSGQ